MKFHSVFIGTKEKQYNYIIKTVDQIQKHKNYFYIILVF